MSRKPARIESPEIIKELRAQFVKFDEACRRALSACDAHVKSTDHWIQRDQMLFLKQNLRKCDEALIAAQREYSQAKWGANDLNRSSGMEEKRVLDRAKRRKEEAETRMAALERWKLRLDDEVGKLERPCISLTNLLDHTTPRALARIDRMLDNLEAYLRPAPPEDA